MLLTTVHIISDGSADLPADLRERWNIRTVPLTVQFGENTYTSDMGTALFYQLMKQSSELPKTSAPSPHAFMEAYQSVPPGQPIVVISLSSELSSTYNHAVLARDMYLQEHPDAGEIEVIDSKTASMGLGLIAYKAARLVHEGLPFREIVQSVKDAVLDTRTYFTLDTLENVIKGGRLDRVRGAIASMMNIKLVMRANEHGSIEVMEKVRGTQQAVKRLIDKIDEIQDDVEKRIIAVAHSNCEERARELLRNITEKYKFKEAVLSDMGPVIGTYAGEGGLLVSY
ncbi:DegV family protein [Paenibacillus alkalitolerans]|uniref:DegV family protein n=1 Tax=Paenibacillus alkalitolerans TaxID=2799335 RepID=UPI0018F5B169|nr:DegV family protein [Paenibacillus alkalitolerans]